MKNKEKVLHIEERFHPLMGYQLNFFAKYHSEKVDFHILTSKSLSLWNVDINTILDADKEFEKKYNVKIHRIDARFDRPNKRNILLKNFKKAIYNINPDIIFLHGIESFTALKFFAAFNSLKKYKIFTDTHTLYNQFKDTLTSKLNFWLFDKIVVPKINKNNIISFGTVPENIEILEKKYNIKKELIYELPIGTDFKQYYFSQTDRDELRNSFLENENTSVLIYTGKFDYAKRPHLILEAVRLLENNLKKELFILFIGAKKSDYYSKYFESLKFENHRISFVILPFIDSKELFKYYSMADFAVLPTENSLSALDMQACKLPVIMQNDITNADRLQKGGLVFEQNNVQELAEKINILHDDVYLRKTLSNEGYSFVKQKFNYLDIVKKMEEIILR